MKKNVEVKPLLIKLGINHKFRSEKGEYEIK